jgi:hypothetical protein
MSGISGFSRNYEHNILNYGGMFQKFKKNQNHNCHTQEFSLWNVSRLELSYTKVLFAPKLCFVFSKIRNGLDAGSGSLGTVETRAFPSTCLDLDEGFALQCFNLKPQAWAQG